MSESSVKPVYVHDCSRCTFLGHANGHDLYHCATAAGTETVVARFGSDGPDYLSGLGMARFVPELGTAKRIARARGLLVNA